MGGQTSTQVGYGTTEQKSVLTCKLADLIFSLESQSDVWKTAVSDLPVSRSTCVTYHHLLLAIGGLSNDKKPSSVVYYYDDQLNFWPRLGWMQTPRAQCFAAVVSDRIFVIGGHGKEGSGIPHSSMEIGSCS